MIKSSTPLVSYVDKPTGMTPLEAAIRKHNYVIVEVEKSRNRNYELLKQFV